MAPMKATARAATRDVALSGVMEPAAPDGADVCAGARVDVDEAELVVLLDVGALVALVLVELLESSDEEPEPEPEPEPDEAPLASLPMPHGMAGPSGCVANSGVVVSPSGEAIVKRVVHCGPASALLVNW